MPAVIPVVAAVAGSYGASLGIGGALFGAGLLGSFGQAVIADSIFGLVASFAVNAVGSSLLGPKKPKGGGPTPSNDQGFQEVVRLSDDSHKIVYGRARVGGTLLYIETYPTANDSSGVSQTGDNLFLHMVIAHTGHEIDGVEEIYLDDTLVTVDSNGFVNESPYKKDGKSYVRIIHHLGSDTQAADSLLVAEATNWTVNHRLRGISYTYMRLQWNVDVFQNGIPRLNLVIRGKKVYDPRTGLTAWSDNAALCIRDYLFSRDFANNPYGFGATASEIDDTFTTAAANICDESITKLDSSTIARYTCNGIVDTATAPLANLEELLGSMVGTVTCPKGVFRIYAGAYDSPESEVVDETWMTGPAKATYRISRKDLFNAVRGLYTAPDKQWQSDDFPEITSSTYEAEDNNERIYTDLNLSYTTDPEAAQRIAKIVQRKGREQITYNLPCNYKALRYTVWDVIKVNNTARGWVEKEFRIVNFTFDVQSGIVIQAREENSLTYSWSAGDGEAVSNAPDTTLPSPSDVAVPSGVAFDSRSVSTAGGDTIYNLVLMWDSHSNAYVTNGGQFEIEFKLSADADWRPSFFVSGALTTADIVSSTPNVSYDLRIRAVNVLGAHSNWVTILGAVVGSTGGIGATLDYGDFHSSPSAFLDYGDFHTSPSGFIDYGSF